MYSFTNYDAEIQFKSTQLWHTARGQQQDRWNWWKGGCPHSKLQFQILK